MCNTQSWANRQHIIRWGITDRHIPSQVDHREDHFFRLVFNRDIFLILWIVCGSCKKSDCAFLLQDFLVKPILTVLLRFFSKHFKPRIGSSYCDIFQIMRRLWYSLSWLSDKQFTSVSRSEVRVHQGLLVIQHIVWCCTDWTLFNKDSLTPEPQIWMQ